MIYSTNFDNDMLVNEAVDELRDASIDYILAKESGDANLSELAELLIEAEQKVENTKKLSLIKRIQAYIARTKKNKEIIEKYKEKALSADVSGLTVKVYDTSDASINKYIKACNAATAKLKPLLKKSSGDYNKETDKEIKAQIKEILAERNKIVKEVESTTERKSTEMTISNTEVKKAINFIESGKAEKMINKVSHDLNTAVVDNKDDQRKLKNGTHYDVINAINGNRYMISCVKLMAAYHAQDNAKTIITTAAYASGKKKKDE
jgi:hypothetical protein|uniref:Uncharacterized protein n=1 Tax=Myoviridae sp. ctcyQ27 TaxID=2825139 RepID=A0A8S5UFI9_9CAUD|nr:MAG TPA: hypothetical protein [Myoviridae sp. ctcyQ27]